MMQAYDLIQREPVPTGEVFIYKKFVYCCITLLNVINCISSFLIVELFVYMFECIVECFITKFHDGYELMFQY